MKHKLLAAAAFAALLTVPSVATAQDTGWYVRGNLGAGAFTDMDLAGDMVGDIEAEANMAGSLGLGYEFGNNWRVELDGSTLWNDMGAIAQTPNTLASMRANSLMINALYDFSDFGRWEPYVGAGLGFVKGQLSASSHNFPSQVPFGAGTGAVVVTNPVCAPICDVNETSGSLGWNLLAGLGYEISDNLTWDTHYRYLNAGDMDFNGRRTAIGSGNSSAINVDVEDIAAHMLMTGFRYRFGASAPKAIVTPPAPIAPSANYACWDGSMVVNASSCSAEPVAVAQPTISCWDGSMVFDAASCPTEPVVEQPTVQCYDGTLAYDQASCPVAPVQTVEQRLCGQEYISQIVYYEFNKPQSAETRSQMENILAISDTCEVGSVSLVGHTDTVGSAAYNLTLSRKRANNVKSELVKLGVPSGSISTDGRGETDLFVPTADNVKEQLNRRVEVGIQLNSVVPSY